MDIWTFLTPVIITVSLNIVVLIVTSLVNRPKVNSEISKLDVEKEDIQTKIWERLYDKLEEERAKVDAKNKEIEARVNALEESKEELIIKLENEKEARAGLEQKINLIRDWLKRNEEKLNSAGVEPIPVNL